MTRSGAHEARRSRPWRRFAVVTALSIVLAAVGITTVLAVMDALDGAADQDDVQTEEVAPPVVIGYVPYWDQTRGFDVTSEHPDLFDEISPVWYSLEPTGEIVLTDAEHTTVDRTAVRRLQEQGVRVIPTVTNLRDGEWDPEAVQAMLHRPEAMETHIRELVRLTLDEGYDGVDIDYEHLRAADRDAYSTFLTDLAAALHAEGKLLTTAVHPKTSESGYGERNAAQDFRAIGAAADQVRVMTYDYSWEDSPPGPVAPAGWVEEVIAWTVTQMPPEKVVLGIVLLGYDWGPERGETVDYEQAQDTAAEHQATVRRADDDSPWFAYDDTSGRQHEVWYEDADSVAAKVPLVDQYDLAGAFFWRLGGEDPDVWSVVRSELR
jgi:spore germination protein